MEKEEIEAYMIKREAILETMKALFPYTEIAEPIYNLVNSTQVTPAIINSVLTLIEETFKGTKEDFKREKIEEAINSLRKIKEQEKIELDNERKESEKDINVFF